MTDETIDTVMVEDEELLRDIGEDETAEAEADTEVDYLARIGELEEKLRIAETKRAERERELECFALLNTAGLPSELKDVVMASSDMKKTVDIIGHVIAARVDTEVSQRCRMDAPATGTRAPLTRNELLNMPIAELQRLRDSGFTL